jgi:hypothetical protein
MPLGAIVVTSQNHRQRPMLYAGQPGQALPLQYCDVAWKA